MMRGCIGAFGRFRLPQECHQGREKCALGRVGPAKTSRRDNGVWRRVVQGIFETLDESGRLILRGPNQSEIAIAAGEVHFGRAATLHEPAKDHH